jgi:hypothetical protein
MTNRYAAQLETFIRNPRSQKLRKKFFGILADVDAPGVEPWIRGAADLRARGIIDDDGWIYFAAMFLECLTFSDAVVDPELLRIQREIDALEAVESWKRDAREYDEAHEEYEEDDDYEDGYSPEMRALFAEYDARAHVVMAMYLRDIGYHELADMVQRDHQTFMDRSEVGASKLFDGE